MAKAIENKNVLLWVVFALIVIGIIVHFYLVNKKANPPVKNIDGNPNPNAAPSDNVDKNKILHKGDRGNTVKALQQAINAKITQYGIGNSIPLLVEDKVFGNATDSALNKLTFQTINSGLNNVTVAAIENGNFSTPDTIQNTGTNNNSGELKVYSIGSLVPVYDNKNDFFPARYAGVGEYIGVFKAKENTYIGSVFNVTQTGRAVAVENSIVKI